MKKHKLKLSYFLESFMKIKQSPEDFKVEEISSFKISQNAGRYKLYLLEKRGLETFALLKILSRNNRIPVHEFAIAGLKDRHAITKQHFTIPSAYEIRTLNEPNFTIRMMGYVNDPIELGDLEGNRFELTVRCIKKGELEGIKQKAETIEELGAPNYFDSQRFGSAINNSFIAKFLIRKEYELAVKQFLTESTKFEPARIKDEKANIAENWQNLGELNVREKSLMFIVQEYQRTKDWLKTYKKIPYRLRELFITSYQSYIWNECVKELLRKVIDNKNLFSIEYNAGRLVFYKKLSDDEKKSLPEKFQMVGPNLHPVGFEKELVDKVLAKQGITLDDLDIQKETGHFFKVQPRQIILRPKEFRISEPSLDELNDRGKNNTYKITLSFILQKGSYATIITKRIFNH
jgi:tRNA pseudouridine13 synthase